MSCSLLRAAWRRMAARLAAKPVIFFLSSQSKIMAWPHPLMTTAAAATILGPSAAAAFGKHDSGTKIENH